MTPDEITQALDLQGRMDATGRIDGRAAGMHEVFLLRELKHLQQEERIKTHGCCCEKGPYKHGKCRCLPGNCRRIELAEAMLKRK